MDGEVQTEGSVGGYRAEQQYTEFGEMAGIMVGCPRKRHKTLTETHLPRLLLAIRHPKLQSRPHQRLARHRQNHRRPNALHPLRLLLRLIQRQRHPQQILHPKYRIQQPGPRPTAQKPQTFGDHGRGRWDELRGPWWDPGDHPGY